MRKIYRLWSKMDVQFRDFHAQYFDWLFDFDFFSCVLLQSWSFWNATRRVAVIQAHSQERIWKHLRGCTDGLVFTLDAKFLLIWNSYKYARFCFFPENYLVNYGHSASDHSNHQRHNQGCILDGRTWTFWWSFFILNFENSNFSVVKLFSRRLRIACGYPVLNLVPREHDYFWTCVFSLFALKTPFRTFIKSSFSPKNAKMIMILTTHQKCCVVVYWRIENFNSCSASGKHTDPVLNGQVRPYFARFLLWQTWKSF